MNWKKIIKLFWVILGILVLAWVVSGYVGHIEASLPLTVVMFKFLLAVFVLEEGVKGIIQIARYSTDRDDK